GIIEHRYQPRLARRLAKYGRFNVGWVGFKSDNRGRRCLEWWGDRTLEWCSDTPSVGRYADQGYLDQFPTLFEGASILEPLGLNLAPWNTAGHHITKGFNGVEIDGDPLVFFHFHGLKRTGRWWMTSQLVYGAPMSAVVKTDIYVPYIRHLERIELALAQSPHLSPTSAGIRGTGLRGLLFRLQRAALSGLNVVSGNAIRAGRN
ncbi:MAG: hypothetical protein Q8M65_09440, partial [Rhodoglobus sp.]|nr:hypothetical protein [Rhodoglobus sp.]